MQRAQILVGNDEESHCIFSNSFYVEAIAKLG